MHGESQSRDLLLQARRKAGFPTSRIVRADDLAALEMTTDCSHVFQEVKESANS